MSSELSNNYMKTNIGITCVGSGIGQSVVDALRICGDSYRLIRFDTNPLAFGGFFCDVFQLCKFFFNDWR